MKLFVGLGNPGAKYARHRHNIGFMAADAIHRAQNFGPWRSKFQAEVAEGRLGDEKVWLIKPQTYMNLSGQSVGEATRYLKLGPGDIWVFHDELDLAPGKVRVKTGGGHAGHNGLRSLHQHVGPDYHRVRLGIGHPGSKDLVTKYVLRDFAREDRAWLEPLMDAVGREAPRLAAGDAAGFMSAVATAVRPPARPRGAGPGAGPGAKDDAAAQNDATAGTETRGKLSEPEGILTKMLAKLGRR